MTQGAAVKQFAISKSRSGNFAIAETLVDKFALRPGRLTQLVAAKAVANTKPAAHQI